MNHAILISKFRGRSRSRLGFGESRIDAFLRVGIEHEELTGVGTSVAEEFETVGLGAGERVLVARNHSSRIFFQTAGADESPTNALFAGARYAEFLGVTVKRRRSILHDDPVANPLFDFRSGPGVHIVLR